MAWDNKTCNMPSGCYLQSVLTQGKSLPENETVLNGAETLQQYLEHVAMGF